MVSSECHSHQPAVAVVGIGNVLLKDEGIGVHVIEAMKEALAGTTDDLCLLDAGSSPDVLLTLDQVNKLIVVDAASGDCEPGTIYRFQLDGMEAVGGQVRSMHEMSLAEWLQIRQTLGLGPKEVVVFGLQPKEIEWGLEPSAEVARRIPEVVNLVLEEARKC